MPLNPNITMNLLGGLQRPQQTFSQALAGMQGVQNYLRGQDLSAITQEELLKADPNKKRMLSALAGVDPVAAMQAGGLFAQSGLTEYQKWKMEQAKKGVLDSKQARAFFENQLMPLFEMSIQDDKIDDSEALKINQLYSQYDAMGGKAENPLEAFYRQKDRATLGQKRVEESALRGVTLKEKKQNINLREGDFAQKVNDSIWRYAKNAGAEKSLESFWYYDMIKELYPLAYRGNATAQQQLITALVKLGDPNSAVLLSEAAAMVGKTLGADANAVKSYITGEARFTPEMIKTIRRTADEQYQVAASKYGNAIRGAMTSANDILTKAGKDPYSITEITDRIGTAIPGTMTKMTMDHDHPIFTGAKTPRGKTPRGKTQGVKTPGTPGVKAKKKKRTVVNIPD